MPPASSMVNDVLQISFTTLKEWDYLNPEHLKVAQSLGVETEIKQVVFQCRIQ